MPRADGGTATARYRNPLRGLANLVPQRIDEGVDYSGTGPVYAVGPGRVIAVWSGWFKTLPFIAYVLTGGPQAGRVIFVAEHVRPTVHVGQRVTSGTSLGDVYGGIETGYALASGYGALASSPSYGGYVEGQRTALGQSFSNFLGRLGAPPGKGGGRSITGTVPRTWPTPSASGTGGARSNAERVFLYLVGHGFSPKVAAAITGTFQAESGVDPTSVNPSSGASGIGQWLGSRLTALQAFASRQGKSWQSLGVQESFVVRELKGYRPLLARMSGQSVQEAARSFVQGYERPGPGGDPGAPHNASTILAASRTGDWTRVGGATTGKGVPVRAGGTGIYPLPTNCSAGGKPWYDYILGLPGEIASHLPIVGGAFKGLSVAESFVEHIPVYLKIGAGGVVVLAGVAFVLVSATGAQNAVASGVLAATPAGRAVAIGREATRQRRSANVEEARSRVSTDVTKRGPRVRVASRAEGRRRAQQEARELAFAEQDRSERRTVRATERAERRRPAPALHSRERSRT